MFPVAVGVICALVMYNRAKRRREIEEENQRPPEPICPLSVQPRSAEVFEWIRKGEVDKVWTWIDELPSRVNFKELQSGMSLLHVSVVFDQPEIVDGLCERGATIDALESSALTPLHLACNDGYIECAEALLHHGASLFSVNTDSNVRLGGSIPIYSSGGQTPLHFAAASGSREIVELLLQAPNGRSVISQPDFDGNTPAMLALLKGYAEIAQYLEPNIPLLTSEQRMEKLQQDYAVRAARITSKTGTVEALMRSNIKEKYEPRYPGLFDEAKTLEKENFAPSFLEAVDKLLASSSSTTSSSTSTSATSTSLASTTSTSSTSSSSSSSSSPSSPSLPAGFGKEIAKGVYAFDFMTEEYCQRWIEEIENYERQAVEKGLPVRRPNSMNNYGLVLNDIGFAPIVDALRRELLQPIMQHLFPTLASQVSSHHTFAVKYKLGEDLDLATHVDKSLITVNLSLGKQFKGGSLYFHGVADQPNAEPPPFKGSHEEGKCQYCELIYDHKPGVAVMHVGRHIHGANQLQEGERVNLIVWFQP